MYIVVKKVMKSLRNDKPKSTHLHVCLVDSRHCPAEVDIAESEPLAPGTGKKKSIFFFKHYKSEQCHGQKSDHM